MMVENKRTNFFSPRILWNTIKKCNPIAMIHNPVMFITEIGAFVTTGEWIFLSKTDDFSFYLQITIWLWLTVIFANFAESIAEARNQAQAESLRMGRTETMARLKKANGAYEMVKSADLKRGDLVQVDPGEIIPGDGEVIEGMGAVDESAVTGESAPVIRAAGTDNTSVTGGTKLLSDGMTIRISAEHGESFMDKMIHLIESAKRKKSANEIALTILLSGLTFIFLVVVVAIEIFGKFFHIDFSATVLVALLVCLIPTTIAGLLSAIGIAGINRLMSRHVLAMTGQAVEAAGDIDIILIDKTGTITEGRRRATEMTVGEKIPVQDAVRVAYFSSLLDTTDEGRSIVEFLQEKYSEHIPKEALDVRFIPFTAETRMSGVDSEKGEYRKGALGAVQTFVGHPLPYELDVAAKKYAQQGGTPLAICDRHRILGVILLRDTVKKGLAELFTKFRKMGIRTIMMTGDNAITAATIAKEAGVDDYIAEVNPHQKLEKVLQFQKEGNMVAMTGDGVNDAPALAHANLGVAMNSGTQAAKEAGNMIDLDSHPTKLFEIIEIGKQMLTTRGSLTTFSIANDVAKYFAVIPAILMPYFPSIHALNIMALETTQSAVLSALIFNALIIPALIPLAFKGVKMLTNRAEVILRRNLVLYGLGGIALPFIGIKLIDLLIIRLGLL